MGGLFLLLVLSVVMALASFLAGALPLSMTLSQSQLRLISSIGVGILVGTSLIVIIPEGVEAVASTNKPAPAPHGTRSTVFGQRHIPELAIPRELPTAEVTEASPVDIAPLLLTAVEERDDAPPPEGEPVEAPKEDLHPDNEEFPTFYIGLSLMLGFILMFLIDRIPQHATDGMSSTPATRHISLDNLGSASVNGDADEETEGFLGSFAPTPRQSKSLATTTGLVIHAAADGIAMGASATTSDMKLGLIIFIAIMIHKAPAAFGLTSILLKQGLSKRAARGHLVAFSLAAPVGALGTYILVSLLGGGDMDGPTGQWWTGMLLLFSAGTFLYVAMHAMQEDHSAQVHDHHSAMNGYADSSTQRKPSRPQMRDTLATVGGMLLPLLTQFGHHH
ncbi:putative zip zinc transporter [Diaporthe ampelina]|uniref:Putative zip zinc transporter n=1 Tax=Diaporthe ampelina TaxID=1214573 RepID=A0A0G2HWQ3_9PEZI|nr:putative zip zinc transporter [Diaporthe ampelina]